MTIRDKNPAAELPASRLPYLLEVYARGISVALMLLGLRQWAVILGILPNAGGMFEQMSAPWQLATMHFAVIDLVAAVGMWQRVAWGNVVWIYAALSAILVHTLLRGRFGPDLLIIAFHVVTLAGFAALTILVRRTKSA